MIGQLQSTWPGPSPRGGDGTPDSSRGVRVAPFLVWVLRYSSCSQPMPFRGLSGPLTCHLPGGGRHPHQVPQFSCSLNFPEIRQLS